MATYEELTNVYLTSGAVRIYDDSLTYHEEFLLEGNMSLTGVHIPYLNATVKTQSAGAHRSSHPGERIYPQFSATFRLARFSSGSVTTASEIADMFLPGGKYASVVNTDTNSPLPHRHFRIEWTTPSAATRNVGLEDLEVQSWDVDMGVDGVMLALSGEVCGRVLVDGECIAREYSQTDTTAPTWLTD